MLLSRPWLNAFSLTTVIIIITLILCYNVNHAIPQAYMDEIFHVPQAYRYCIGSFSTWDPMITTLPGLYIISLILLRPLALLYGDIDMHILCSTAALRSVNTIMMLCMIPLLSSTMTAVAVQCSWKRSNASHLHAAVLTCFPLMFFFAFLYYTDVMATFFVILTYRLSLGGRHVVAGIAGILAVLVRQTNIIWVAWIAGTRVIALLISLEPCKEVSSSPIEFVRAAWRYRQRIIVHMWPYIAVAIIFVGFLVFNNGIVVGDRSSHRAVFHLAQLLYFSAFTTILLVPHVIVAVPALGRTIRNRWPTILCTTVFAAIVVKWFRYTHPYVLADNRHYTFYLWRRLLGTDSWLSLSLVPAYGVAIWALWTILRLRGRPLVWCLLLAGAITLVLVPQQLLELRYFIIPFMMYRIHTVDNTLGGWALFLELMVYVAINLFTLYLFIACPFTDSKGETQRFMW